MKYLLCSVFVLCFYSASMAQDAMFFAAGQVARGPELFVGAEVVKTTFVSTQADVFATAPVQDHTPAPVPPPLKSPVQAPTNVQAPAVHYHQPVYRTAPVRRQWFRFGNRRGGRVLFRGWFGGC